MKWGFNIAIRAFIAIELPEKLIALLGAVQAELKAACGLTKGWTRPESIHLTIKFLGGVDEEKLPEIIAALQGSASGLKPFTLTAGVIGGFPNLRAPRILWMGVPPAGIKDSPELKQLQQNIENRLNAIGIAKETRPFRAHLTFLRIQEPENCRKAGIAVKNLKHEISMDFYVDSFVLFKSTLSPKGARHDIIERIQL